jgi:ATP-dependent Clp protease, protease subunit
MISNSVQGAAVKKIDEFNASDRIGIKLLENSVHFLVGEIAEENIAECVKWIVYENFDTAKSKVLTLYINSTGGNLYDAFALIDVMRTSHHPVRTISVGTAMSAAFLIFAAGAPGERYAAKNASFMCHQFTENMDAKYHDLKATMRENDICNQKMVDILKEATGMAPSVIKKKLLPASDVYLTAEELIELGVADHLL